MADRERQDFVKLRLKDGIGSANVVAGNFSLRVEAGEVVEVTRAEWTEIYEPRKIFELVTMED